MITKKDRLRVTKPVVLIAEELSPATLEALALISKFVIAMALIGQNSFQRLPQELMPFSFALRRRWTPKQFRLQKV